VKTRFLIAADGRCPKRVYWMNRVGTQLKERIKMLKRTIWIVAILALGAGVYSVVPATWGEEPAKRKQTAEDVAKLWSPELKSTTESGQTGGSPKQSPNVAAYSFYVVGPTFEEVWNHYAKLCGLKQKYAEKTFLISADAGPNGSYVVSDRATRDGKGGRALSTFLLKTDAYTVTVTFQPDPDGKSINGSLSVVMP
jgi:hypothetical protein